MTRHSKARRWCSGLLPVLFSLGALHCDDGATIILPAPEAEWVDAPVEQPAASGEGAPPGPDVPGNPGENGGSESGPPTEHEPTELSSSDETPSGGTPTDPGPFAECQPRASGGPFWLAEGNSIQIPFECATGATLPGDAFQFSNLPANATFDAASHTLTFTPGLDQAGVYSSSVGIRGSTERGQFEVQVADRFDAPGNVPVNPATYTQEFGVPVLHLSVDPLINDESYLPARVTYRGHAFEGAEAKYRGTTSLRYAQKSFTLKFTKADRFNETQSVAGFTDKRKVTLTTTLDDNSYLRARLALELWNRIGDGHIKVQAYNVVVYLEGQFWGVYTLTDHVDGYLMEDNGLFQDGNLYKARNFDANFSLMRFDELLGPKESLSEGYTKEEGTPLEGMPGANADLESFVSWVATSTPQGFLADLPSRLALREYEDWWMLASLSILGDSASKNSYHYRDARPGADGRFRVVPWDFNDSFGQTWYTDRAGREADRDPEELNEYNLLFQRLLTEPATRAPLIARYRSVLENEWELGSILQTYDGWARAIEAVASRSEARWNPSYTKEFAKYRTSFTSHAEEVAFVRQWITDRWTYVRRYYRAQ